ncbi:uncharacterized protein [Montipora capricornis]|uniref:uncharacterized protein n=1 Tax=Montipora capricornis TaxID=246305 RepID=UPI0035F19117
MGGAIYKDSPAIKYEERNIYLNSIQSLGRLPPTRPTTIHQKALFVLWLSIVLIWVCLKSKRYYSKWRDKCKAGKETGDAETADKENDTVLISLYPVSKQPSVSRFGRGDATEESTGVRNIFDRLLETDPDQPSFEDFLTKAVIFGAIMLYFWLCDYQHIWPKTKKQYSRDMYIFLFALLVIVALVYTVRETPEKLVNRDQTEEWKGWMQVQFVWYHYYDAHEVFNSIRCYIAAYVWMTGFGNFSYFWIKKDYSLFRLLRMMFRLNFLVVMVMAVTNHEFVRYYVCAMHTYWFLTVYAMLAVFKSHNENRYVMASKFVIYLVINTLIFDIPGVSYKVFWPFQFVLNVNGSLRYWVYRSTLDHCAAWVGMLCAYNYPYIEQFLNYLDKKHDTPRAAQVALLLKIWITVALFGIFVMWFHFVLMAEREFYKAIHPFTSPIAIVIFLWFRNLHPFLRSRYLGLFSWLGKITLETYLSQIHIYMIANAERLLVYIPRYPMINFMLATIIYVAISYVLFHQTLFFNTYIFPKNVKVICKNIIVGTVWLALCYLLSFTLNKVGIW